MHIILRYLLCHKITDQLYSVRSASEFCIFKQAVPPSAAGGGLLPGPSIIYASIMIKTVVAIITFRGLFIALITVVQEESVAKIRLSNFR